MSLSPVVDQNYRLAATDLGGRPRAVLVRQVGLQGLEDLAPLLYFEHVARPLALDHDQRVQMCRIARSHLLADWIGAALILRPAREQGRETIHLLDFEERALQGRPANSAWDSNPAPRDLSWLRVVVLLLLLGLAAWLVLTLQQAPDLSFWTDLIAQ